MESWVQLPPAHGYESPCTMKVRGLVQSMCPLAMGVIERTGPMRAAAKRATRGGMGNGHGWP